MQYKTATSKLVVALSSLMLFLGCANNSTNSKNNVGEPLASAMFAGSDSPNYKQAAQMNVELGIGYLKQGQTARAKSKFMHALKLAPQLPEVHAGLAYFFDTVGESKEAEKEYKKAINLGKHSGALYNNYGAFLCKQARYKEADAAFRDALKDKTYARTADVFENAGICALKNSQYLEGENYLKTALRYEPNRPASILELAYIDLQKGRILKAKELLNQYASVGTPTPRSLALGIELAIQLGDKESLESCVLSLQTLFPHSPEYQAYLKTQNKEP